MIRILFAALLALVLASEASRADTYGIDLFIGAPAQDGFVQIVVGPTETLYIPVSAFPENGRLSLDDNFAHNQLEGEAIPGALGKDQLKKKIAGVFDDVNRAYAPAGISFRVRSITFIDPAKAGLGPRVNKDEPTLNLGVTKDKDGKEKSDLLDRFKTFAGNDRSSFKMLMVPIADEASSEQGRAETGIHSVVDLGNVFHSRDTGVLVAHELGHNFGLQHLKGANPFRHFMAESLPDRRPGRGSPNTPCENLIGGEGCERIEGIINNYRSQRWVEERGGSGDGGGQQTEETGNEESE